MRIDLGPVRVEFGKGEDPVTFLRGLLRPLNNLELADMLGVSPKTVQRWKADGRLPRGEGNQVRLLDLLQAGRWPGRPGGKMELPPGGKAKPAGSAATGVSPPE